MLYVIELAKEFLIEKQFDIYVENVFKTFLLVELKIYTRGCDNRSLAILSDLPVVILRIITHVIPNFSLVRASSYGIRLTEISKFGKKSFTIASPAEVIIKW